MIDPKVREAILNEYPRKSIRQLAKQFNLSRQEVKAVVSEMSGQTVLLTEGGAGSSFFGFWNRLSIKWMMIVLVAGGFLIYANSFDNEFVWDDQALIVKDLLLGDFKNIGKELTHPLGYWGQPGLESYRPMQTLSYMIDRHFWGLRPFGFHLTNTLVHVLNACLLLIFFERLTHKRWVSFFSALLFLVHPIHNTAVTYLSGRDNVLFLFFVILSLTFYVLSRQKQKHLTVFRLLSWFAFIGALMSKEVGIIFPLAVLLVETIFFFRKEKKQFSLLVMRIAPYILISAAYGMFYKSITSPFLQPFDETVLTRRNSFLILSPVLMKYFRLLIIPHSLHMDYMFLYPKSFFDPWIFSAFVVCVPVLVILVWAALNSAELKFAVLWFFLWLFPFLNLLFPLNATMAEHWLYVPSVGFFLGVSCGFLQLLKLWPQSAKVLVYVLTGLIIFYSVLTIRQNEVWRSEETLYIHTLHYSPKQARVWNNLGAVYEKKGNLEKALECYEKAVQLRPDLSEVAGNLNRLRTIFPKSNERN